MSTYAQNYNKLMTENGPQVKAAFKKATELAMNHNLHHVCGEDGEAYPLKDMLTLKGQKVNNGEEEIELLLDSILVDALMAYEGMLDS